MSTNNQCALITGATIGLYNKNQLNKILMPINKNITDAFDAPKKNKQAGKNENENLNAGEDDLVNEDAELFEDESVLDEEDFEKNDFSDEEADEIEWDESK